ncbi:MAG: hypothetical protein ACRCTY_04175, partial [Candidatus Adiutrix sp.]
MGLMTLEEEAVVLDAIRAAEVAGDYEEAGRLMRHVLPLAPHLAMAAKEIYGKSYLIDRGYNLAEADKEF